VNKAHRDAAQVVAAVFRYAISASSLLKNLEIGALAVFLPWGFGAVGML
jgi:hypothetical protein